MRDPAPRRPLAIAALCVAAFVCVQIGAIHVAERDRGARLAAELENLRNGQGDEVAALRTELARAQRDVIALRRKLAGASGDGTQLESALRNADATRAALTRRLAQATEALAAERPFVDVHLVPSRGVLAATAENRGQQTLAIEQSRGWLWVDGQPLALDGALAPTQLEPGSEAGVFDFDPGTRSLEFVPESNAPVRGALCFVYGREFDGASAPWVEERWFEYRPASGTTATLRRQSWPLDAAELPCDLDAQQPPW